MVRGIGTDIVEIARIEKLVQNYGAHFFEKVFTEIEIDYCSQKARPATHFAGRWAAKEAFYKSLPLPAQKFASWKSIEIIPDRPTGKPEIRVISTELSHFFWGQRINSLLLSISHERGYCVAMVVLE